MTHSFPTRLSSDLSSPPVMRRRWYATAAMALLEGRRAPARTRAGMAACHLRGMTNGTWADPPVTGGQRSGGIGSLVGGERSEEHTSELQSLMRIPYAVSCLKTKTQNDTIHT